MMMNRLLESPAADAAPTPVHSAGAARRARGPRTAIALAAALLCSGLLGACGGGGGGGPVADGPRQGADVDGTGGGGGGTDQAGAGGSTGGGDGQTPTTPMASLPVTVIDGPIEKAVVCLDQNLNGACDSGEPAGVTDTAGKVVLAVPADQVGRYPVVAVVGTDAVDRDHGPVTQAFTMRAPASQSAVISPLTTLVQAQVDTAGVSLEDAAALVQSQLGLSQSVFTDFTAGADAASTHAGNAARLLVVVTQQHNAALQAAVGATDSSGAAITRQDLDKVIAQALLNMLPALGDVAANQLTGTPEQVAAATSSAATTLVSDARLSTDKVALAVGGNKMIEQEAAAVVDTPVSAAGWNVRWFQFADADNWFVRANVTTADQAIPDADGLLRFSDVRERKTGSHSDAEVWGESSAWTRTDLFWDGASWWNCPTDFEHTTTPRDAQGVSHSTYCKTSRTTSKRGSRDIGGKRMVDIVREIRAYPLQDTFGQNYGGWANWGPDPESTVLGTATFPAGAKLHFQSYSDTAFPDAYNPVDANSVLRLNKEDSAGGASCPNAGASEAGSLDEVIRHSGGQPCSFSPTTATGARNEWWGNATIRLALLSNAVTPSTSYYSGDLDIRAALDTDGTARFYACPMRAANPDANPPVSASPRNCDLASTGSYRIESQGDARVMRFAGLPAQLSRLSYERIFVERGEQVFFGSRAKPANGHSIRLNDTAAKALFIQIGLPELAED